MSKKNRPCEQPGMQAFSSSPSFVYEIFWEKKVMAVIDAKNDDNAVEIPLGATQAESGDSEVEKSLLQPLKKHI